MTDSSPASSLATQTAVLRGPCHHIAVEIAGRGWVSATFTCTAAEGADCRLTCPEGCPEWDTADHIHTLIDAGECMALPWLDAEEWDEQYAGPAAPLRSGPIELEFTGDGYTWTYAERWEPPRIVVHPGRMGGQPTVGDSRITAELVAGVYWQHGMAEAETQWEPHVDRYGVLAACWYMARYGGRPWRKRWAAWLRPDDIDGADNRLWRTDRQSWDACPLPPTVSDTTDANDARSMAVNRG